MKLVTKSLERAFLNSMEPMVDWLVEKQVRPNTITTWGVLLVLI